VAAPAAAAAADAARRATRRHAGLAGKKHKRGGETMFSERQGYIVWVSDLKAAKSLDKYGTVHYVSRKMHYVVLYMNTDRAEETVRNIQRLNFVKKVERSYRNEIKTEYDKNIPDKTRFYSV
jgi:uncharacterized protein YlbG (UPF0298 family)